MSKKFLSPIKLAQGASNPAVGSAGELFFNTTDVKVYAHNGTSWVPSGGGVTVSATAPSTPIAGDAWYDTVDGTLYVYYNDGDSSQWVEVAANSGISVALEGRLGVVETYVTTLQSEMDTAQADIDAVESRALSLETRTTALELADSTTNKAGLVPVVPTTIAISSGTATANSNSSISFSAVTSISLNNVFTSAYANYLLVWDITTSQDAVPAFRLRSNGTDTTTGYMAGRFYQIDTTIGGQNNGSNASWGVTPTAVQKFEGSMTLYKPFLSANTHGHHSSFMVSSNTSATTIAQQHGTQAYLSTTSYDGVTLYSNVGTMTGTLTVYGLR